MSRGVRGGNRAGIKKMFETTKKFDDFVYSAFRRLFFTNFVYEFSVF